MTSLYGDADVKLQTFVEHMLRAEVGYSLPGGSMDKVRGQLGAMQAKIRDFVKKHVVQHAYPFDLFTWPKLAIVLQTRYGYPVLWLGFLPDDEELIERYRRESTVFLVLDINAER